MTTTATSRNSDRNGKTVQALTSAVLATVSVIAVTYLTKRRERPIEAVFDAGMDYQRRITAGRRAATS